MIIKDDKVVEPVGEHVSENPPPYSPEPAPQVRVAVVDQSASSLSLSQTLNENPNIAFQPRGISSASLVPSPTAVAGPVPASSSSVYSDSTSSSAYKPPDIYPSVAPPPDVPRTGYFFAQRKNQPISQRIVVDPYYPFPPEAYQDVIAGLGTGEEEYADDDFGPRFGSPVPGDPGRRNVRLECSNSNISAEVWVVGQPAGDPDDDVNMRKKAGIDIRTKNGFVRVKMHASPSSPSFTLRVASKNGGVRVALPRTFSGPLTTRTRNGWASLSPALASCTTAFSEVHGTRKSFIGDFVESGYGKGEWHGSSVDITCENGRIKLCYLDEDAEKSISGFLGRLFS